jgi:DNA repair exonuclease SbcCD nuclease subunit
VIFKFLHVADCHLGSPLRGLAARDADLAGRFDRAVWRAFESTVDVALAEKVAFMLIAGDVFDRDWRDWSTGQAFVRTLARATEAGVRVVMIRGNHDAESIISQRLPLPPGAVWLPADEPGSIDWPDLGVAVHGMSFREAAVSESIVERYPAPLPGRFNIGLLHTSLDGRPDVDRYAPTSLEALVRKGYDYWALGHVHVREVVRDAAPAVVFPGNIQSRSIRETGAKSVTLATVDGGTVRLGAVPVDHARFALVPVDLAGASGPSDVDARVRDAVAAALPTAEGRLLAVRIRLEGETELADALSAARDTLRQELQTVVAALPAAVAVEKVEVACRPRRDRPTGLAGLDIDAVLDAVVASDGVATAVAEDRAITQSRLPHGAAGAATADDGAILSAALALVRARLAGADR